MNSESGKFSTGFILGLLLGGGLVFLLGTRTGKNLLKIISEQGLEGISDLLEEYDLEDSEEEENESLQAEETTDQKINEASNGQKKETPKKRFFKRFKR